MGSHAGNVEATAPTCHLPGTCQLRGTWHLPDCTCLIAPALALVPITSSAASTLLAWFLSPPSFSTIPTSFGS